MSEQNHQPVLELTGVTKHFPVQTGMFSKVSGWIRAVDGISLRLNERETLGLVGESGCGKTTTAKLVLLLEEPTSGTVKYHGKDINQFNQSSLREYRRRVQAVFQDPWSSLNPRMRIGSIIAEPLEVNSDLSRSEIKERVEQVLAEVGLEPAMANMYPHEASGGQRQRIAVARALSSNPDLLILDEPVSALDVSIQAQVMNLLKDIQDQQNISNLLIAHHLGTVRYLTHWVAVMYLGQIVEEAETQELFDHALHPYTQALLSAALPARPDEEREEIILRGEVPSPLNPPAGCRFHPRCPLAMPVCSEKQPETVEAAPHHKVACHLYPG